MQRSLVYVDQRGKNSKRRVTEKCRAYTKATQSLPTLNKDGCTIKFARVANIKA